MEHLTTHLHETKNYEITPRMKGVTEGSYHSTFFFHAFPEVRRKLAINRISLILPSRKEEREILFPFAGTRRLDLAIRRMLGINNSLLGLRPPRHYERPQSVQWDVSIYLSLDSKWEQV
ncbi:hypothetical protein Sjap_008607 [Stephania japonica]|uniref:Uncharacterized protein n=1 Tax=Stephania japonica TaxID=461633 RepID=A0AAP0JPT9_9MAGN